MFENLIKILQDPQYLFILVVIVIVAILRFKTWSKRKRLQQTEFKESLTEGAIEEPHPFRHLTEYELAVLKDVHQVSSSDKRTNGRIAFIFLLVLGVGGILFFYFLESYSFLSIAQSTVFLTFSAFTFMLFLILFVSNTFRREEENYYHDLKLPAWQVQGYLHLWPRTKDANTIFSVRNQTFTLRKLGISDIDQTHQRMINGKINRFKEGDEVIVEYSPFSHYIWRIAKTSDS